MKTIATVLVSALALITASPGHASVLLNKEGLIGATAGGLAGGIIGHQSEHEAEGALLGSLAGFAIGTTIHRQKQRHEQREREKEIFGQMASPRLTADQPAPEQRPTPAPEPQLSKAEQQQLLLQATPLFSVKRPE